MNRITIGIIAILIFSFASIAGFYGYHLFYYPPPYKTIPAIEVAQLIATDNEERIRIVIVDVRNVEDYNEGHIEGGINIPLQHLETAIGNLEHYKNNIVIAYSQNGIKGSNASKIFTDNGFVRVYNLDGGISAWIKEGFPIIPAETSEGCKECGND